VSAATQAAVSFEKVHKRFDGKSAVDDLTFHVPPGSVYGLLGPNGAGKTTSIRMLMTILKPDAGSIRVLGAEPSDALKDRIGYLPEERGLYRGMKVIDNLAFFGAIHGLPMQEARRRGRAWLSRFDMTDSAERKLQELSRGNQQKIQFIAAVLHEPELCVLDEPFSGLDPVNQELMRRTIREFVAGGSCVILSTHLMDEVERVCTHLTLISDGRALVTGELGEVKRRHGTDVVHVEFSGDAGTVGEIPCVRAFERIGNTLEIRLESGGDPAELLRALVERVAVRRFEVRAPSLNSIFMQLVAGERRRGGANERDGGRHAPSAQEVVA
jgi:ABC-2 type transport system ATP-binding protein